MKFDISKKWCEAAAKAEAEAAGGVEAGVPPETWVGWQIDGKHLLDAAELLEGEAKSWADGFAVARDGGVLEWTQENEWAHVRHYKLVRAAEFLRAFAARQGKRQSKG